MAIISLIIISFFLTVLNGQTIKQHPKSDTVTEGTWANFTCTFKSMLSGHLKWRIGSFLCNENNDEYCVFEELQKIDGLNVTRGENIKYSEEIKIYATAERDGTPIQCMFDHHYRDSKDAYSKYAILTVLTDTDNSGYNVR